MDSVVDTLVGYRSIQSIYDKTNLLCSEMCFILIEEPSTFASAVKQEVWRKAIKDEISAIMRKNMDSSQTT